MRHRLLLLLLLVILMAGGAALWFRFAYLQPDRILETLQQRIQEALGLPVELEAVEMEGMDRIHIQGIRVLDPMDGSEIFKAQEAKGKLRWISSLVGRTATLETSLESAGMHLRHDATRGWNLSPVITSAPVFTPSGEEDPGHPLRGLKAGLKLRLHAGEFQLDLLHDLWGEWMFHFPTPVDAELVHGPNDGGRLQLAMGVAVEKGSLPNPLPLPPGFANNLVRALDPTGASLTCSLGISWKGGKVDLQSVGANALVYRGASHEISVDRFRLSGEIGEGTRVILQSASLESARASLASWRNPVLSSLRVPWTQPPEGPLSFNCGKLVYTPEALSVDVSGISIQSVTLDAQNLPWLRILTQRELWGLKEVEVGAELEMKSHPESCEWKNGTIVLSGGKGGRIGTQGFFRGGLEPQWEVTSRVEGFPVPAQQLGGQTLEPGLLSAEMTWGEKKDRDGRFHLSGSGHIVLNEGEIGSVRLLGRIDELLNLTEVAHTRFSSLSFDFKHENDSLVIRGLDFKSSLLDLRGEGTYTGDGQIDVTVTAQSSAKLVDLLRTRKAKTLIGALDQADPTEIRIFGLLEDPSYSIVPGEGMTIPLDEILSNFQEK